MVLPDGMFEKPLKELGATPPETVFCWFQMSDQNVAVAPIVSLPSPITKFPPGVHEKTITLREAVDGR